ncbi:DHS-like NAD/FAD-binding domain-containing protein [Chaetomium strumarium]|uniref:protein acetyllysine N-acetyltransferase n=1 Tax=Chaetomium strumarium TaxID=1170767 RepID=A0AAJ0GX18_9PEZI|nr:DHS-like NAD/FAD-binding domain-containing protein [Chaetomium strumarium]
MAWTADKVPLPELVEAPDEIDQKAHQLAELTGQSKHFIVFTGAGVSTSAGIPDFRGPDGAWTLQAQGRQRTTAAVSTLQAIPTATHMALVELQNPGLLKYLVSQNCDGLHRRSGILPDKISELHGNNNREICKDCGKEYIRDFHAELALAYDHAKKADLCLVLGSSLTVSPANDIPEVVGKRRRQRGGAKLAICNLQATPLDAMADLRVHAKTDELMVKVMRKLGMGIPGFALQRRLSVHVEAAGERRAGIGKVIVSGVDVDGTPVSFLRSVKLVNNQQVLKTEPFEFDVRGLGGGLELKMELEFMGHYGEPNLEVVHLVQEAEIGIPVVYVLEYNPSNGERKAGRQYTTHMVAHSHEYRGGVPCLV